MDLEQLPDMIELGFRLFESHSTYAIDTGIPKPSGLGMVSISKTSAARMQFGATWRIDVCRIRRL